MKAIVGVLSVVSSVLVLQTASGGTWYVAPPPLGNNKNPGTEEHPFAAIQRGIDAAKDGDTVIIAQGTYVENINFKGKNITVTSANSLDWNVVANTVIDGNKAGSVVTFVGTEDETCVLSGFTIRNGRAFVGGGILGAGSMVVPTGATIQNNMVIGNHAYGGGDYGGCGGIWGCAGRLENNIIAGNSADEWGGGVGGMEGVMVSCLIIGNSAFNDAGVGWSHGTFQNCTICWNRAGNHGGGIAHYNPPIQNCIIWGNTAPSGPQFYDISSTPTYSCIEGWTGGGGGNITANPQFVDPDGPDDDPNTLEDNDYRLLLTSRCIDAGINEDWMNGAVDLDGNPRILLGATSLTVDMGAYEYRFDLAIGRNTESNVGLSWTMRPQRSYTVFSSSDMILPPWAEETTILGGKTGGPASWIDPSASSALKFYKIAIE